MIFVIEFMRHGASLIREDEDTTQNEKFGIPSGHLTKKGRADAFRIGQERRREYINQEWFPEEYNASSFLTLTSFSPKSRDSGERMMQGMFPL